MKLTTRGRYGVAALCELVAQQREAPVRLRDIATGQALSERYLEQIFMALRRGGLVRSVRGAQGGYVLAREPESITIGEVIRVLEGPISPVACVADGAAEAPGCRRDDSEHCPTRVVWARLARCMSRVLDSVTLADITAGDGEHDLVGCPNCSLPHNPV